MKQLEPRRTRLLAAASCRLMVPLLEPPQDRIALDALNTVELFADTGKTKAALKRARKAVSEARESLWRDSLDPGSGSEALWAIQTALSERTPADAIRRSVAGMMLARTLGLHAGWRLFYGPYRDIAGLPPGLAF
ncbi:MAG TPA: hypothetical protein VMZ71_11010, partial [Gemmataceae bacterium]|nr:hypothetical protein [Gemmataceae bacterium]